MDCTLKIIAGVGPDNGQEFVCAGPETYIGRSQRCAVRLASGSVSFEHALITRMGDEFYVENLSANGTLLNNQRLLAKTRLNAKDQLRLGNDTVIRVERLPAAATAGSSRRWLLIGFVVMLVVLLVVVIVDPFSGTEAKDWAVAYRQLQIYAQLQTQQRELPAETPELLREAWRLDLSGDRTNAANAWKRLDVLLDHWDQKQGRPTDSPSTRFLAALKNGEKVDLTDDEDMHSALKQFVRLMGRRK
jgi:hypothetical protein